MSSSDTDMGMRVAACIEDGLDEVAALLTEAFLRQYPDSRSSSFSTRALEQWSRDELADLLCALRGEPVRPRHFLYSGDMQVKVDPLLLSLMTFVESRLFVARTLGPYVWRRFVEDAGDAQEALASLEAGAIRVIRINVADFLDNQLVPGSILRPSGQGASRAVSVEAGMPGERSHVAVPPYAASPSLPPQAVFTPREREVIRLVAEGKTNSEIAVTLGMAQNTVKNHLSRIYDKLNVNTRTELAREAIDAGLV